jgi:hypothetical protein
MKTVKHFFVLALVALVLTAVSCAKLDVVGTDSARAFGEVLEAIPQQLSYDDASGGWSLVAPDGGARFVWSRDFQPASPYDAALIVDARPFVDAGLDVNKLGASYIYRGDTLTVGAKFDNAKSGESWEAVPLACYKQIVKHGRKSIGYHAALDHYGVNVGGGNLIEWAQTTSTNDKDIVFVLDPAPLVAAGVDPSRVTGWLFAKVTVDDENGKPVEVDKLLKPFDLR